MESPRLGPNALDIPRPRRVVTAPVSASVPSRPSTPSSPSRPAPSGASGSDDIVETLYSHPSVRIISFTSSRRDLPSLPISSDNDAPPGSLPPSSRLERTIAVGAFRIYRAPGSVAFLSCGSALQPILPRSQCWCINEDNSRFVLQIRRPQYWRIEVPVADPDDAQRAVLLRDVFDKILLFEKTECPFERSFTVKLPDPPRTPIKKKAWTAEGKNLLSSPFQSDLSPPAHAPKAISRGRRATSISRDMSPASIRSTIVSEAQHKVALEGGHQSSEDVISNPKVRRDIALVRPATPSGYDHDQSVGALHRKAAYPPSPSESIRRDSSAPPSAHSSPPTSPEASLLPEVSTPGSSFAGLDASHGETRVRSIETPCLDLPLEQLVVEDNDKHQPPGPTYIEEQKEIAGVDVPQMEEGPEVIIHPARESPRSTQVSDGTVSAPADAVAADTHSLPDQEDASVSELGQSDDEDSPASFEGSGRVAPVNLARKRMTRMLAGRSYTAPPPVAAAASHSRTSEPAVMKKETQPPPPPAAIRSPSASTDSFHSVQSWHSSMEQPLASSRTEDSDEVEAANLSESPSPAPYPSERSTPPRPTIDIPSSLVSDACSSAEVTPRPFRTITDERSKESVNSESVSRASRLSTFEDKRRLTRRRSHASNLSMSRRALSPLPPAANLFTPPPRQTSQSRLALVRRLPAAIIHKTVEILLSPPSHLVNLMLKVAAKIAAGEWRGLVFGFGEAGEQIPVQWDYYSDGEFSDWSDSDDYTLTTQSSSYSDNVPHAGLRRRTTRANDNSHDVD